MPGMSMNRLLSRRDKDGAGHKRDKSRDKSLDKKSRPLSTDGILGLFSKGDPQKKADKPDTELIDKVAIIKERLNKQGYNGIGDEHINYALASKHADGDVDKGFEMALLFQQSVEGTIKPYDPQIEMLGAENRGKVTCYLDSLLFAMYARQTSFEPILRATFNDEPRRRLSTLIRLWVNMLRTGKLIPTDVTEHLQEALAACGWEEAAKLEQQDTSEAFRFITEKLELPLLTLKVDIYHPGTEDDEDDHKLVHERLLEVGIPSSAPGGSDREITLEDCLENYFNNQISVQRRIAKIERSATLSSIRSGYVDEGSSSAEKGSSQHVEVTEMEFTETPTSTHAPPTPLSPGSRHRTMSVIQPIVVEQEVGQEEDEAGEGSSTDPEPYKHARRGSLRKRRIVTMPAWQFFNLLPWINSSKNSPAGEAGVYEHFKMTNPVLGICLKRYGFANGNPTKNKAYVDIPTDLSLPRFVDDGKIPEDGKLAGTFKLSLQAAICHRGDSVTEGHYITIMRRGIKPADGDSESKRRLSDTSRPPSYSEEEWIKFDDLGMPRVSPVTIAEALRKETPYLLFYQILQIDEHGNEKPFVEQPPAYANSGIEIQETSPELGCSPEPPSNPGYFDGARDNSMPEIRLSVDRARTPTPRRSTDLLEPEERRPSIAFTDTSIVSSAPSIATNSAPSTPVEETTTQRITRAAASFAKSKSKSRPSSQSGETRIGSALSKLNLMRSKDQLFKQDRPPESADTLISTDGSTDQQPRVSITIEDRGSPRNGEASTNATPSRSGSKKKKKRDKSRGPATGEDGKDGKEKHHHIHRSKGKNKEKEKDGKFGKGEKGEGIPDRECMIM